MSEVAYSTIKEGEMGRLLSVSVPCDLPDLTVKEKMILALTIHADIQKRLEEWFDEQFERDLNGR